MNQESAAQGEEEEVCAICIYPVAGDEDAASVDKCGHPFHFTCIVKVRGASV